MMNEKKIDINKEIIIEKSNFILKNSYFFYRNLMEKNEDIIDNLKQILLSPLPLTKCGEYEELLNELNKYKIKSFKESSYRYSLEVLFYIVNRVRNNSLINHDNIELLRLYTKFISRGESTLICYKTDNIISIDKNKYEEITKHDKQLKKNKMH